MARRSQCSSSGDNPLDPNYLPPHYREEYRLAIDALIEADLEGYYGFLQDANVVDFLSRPEIEYIKCTVQVPCQHPQSDRRYGIGDGDGSSDTYWPIHSDLDAPGLDLGWPQQQRFVGPTEITTLVNPPDPEMPSIKEQVRRMVKNAQQVVAVAMDMFTDVDIFADILNAARRNVAVYVLLDEFSAHTFVAMVNNCRVNLDEIKFLRVRTVSGSTYYCHTGKSFKGQMMNRFILVDSKIVLSGNYSFMWSFEKIHRCIAHVFVGQFVATFDEEFRILFAQSEPLVMENAMPYVENYGNFPQRHNIENPSIFMKEHLPIENLRAEWTGRSFEDPMKVQPNLFSFRRGDSIHSSTDEHLPLPVHATQQFRGEHPFLDQRTLMQGLNKDIGGFRRQGYAGVPNYPQMNTGNRGEHNIEGLEMQGAHFSREQYFSQRPGPEPGYEMYRKPRDYSYPQPVQYQGPNFPHEVDEVEPPGGYDHVQRFLHSRPTVEKVPAGNLLVPVESPPRRHSMGQSFPCQTSPTQPNLPEQKHFFNVHHKRQDQKEGLRDWRISSYLTALQHSGQEDMEDLQRNDSFDFAPYDMQKTLERPCDSDILEPRQDHHDFTKAQTCKVNVQPLDNLSLPEKSLDLQAGFRSFVTSNAKQTPITTSESSSNTEDDKPEEPKEINLTREESFRRRPNLAVQRSSRLRHSLIFSSNLEQHTTEDAKNSLNQSSEDDPLKKSAVVSNILERKKTVTREPFQWSNLVKPPCDPSLDLALKTASEDIPNKKEESEGDKGDTTEVAQKYSQMEKGLSQELESQVTENTQIQPKPSAVQQPESFVDMNDPDCRLRFFKELAAKRKAELAQANLSTKDKISKDPEKSNKSLPIKRNKEKEPASEDSVLPQAATDMLPTSSQKCPVNPSELNTKATSSQVLPDENLKHKSHDCKTTEEHGSPKSDSSCRAIPTSATDAEKIKLKQQLSEEHDSSQNTVDDNTVSVAKPGLQLGLRTRPKLLSHLRSIPNISSAEFSRTKFSFPSVRRPKLSPTDPTALQTGLIQHSSPAETEMVKQTDTTQHTPAAETSPSQQTPGAKIGSPQQVPAVVIGPSQQSPAAETGHSKHSSAAEKRSSVPFPSAETKPSQQSPEAKIGLFQQSPAVVIGHSQQTSAADTGPSQATTAAMTGLSKQSPAKEMDPSQPNPVAETIPSQHIPAAETIPCQQILAKETGPSEQISAAETDTSEQIPAAKTVPSQQICVSETDHCQQILATKTGPSLQIPGTETDPSQHILTAHTSFSQQILAAKIDPSKQKPVAETGPFQKTPAVEMDPSQQISATETDPLQQIPAADTDPSKQIPAADTDPSKQISAAETDPSKQILSAEMVPSKHIPVAETVSSQQIPAPDTVPFQQIPSAETDPSEQMCASDIDHSQQILVAKTGPSLQITTAETVPSQHILVAETSFSQQILAAETDPSGQRSVAETGLSQNIPAAETDPFKQIPAAETVPFQQISAAETDASKQIPYAEMVPSKLIPVAETVPSPQIPAADTVPFRQVPAAETDPSQQMTAAETDPFKQIPAAETVPFQQISAAETDASKQIPYAEMVPSKLIPVAETVPSPQIPAAEMDPSKQIPAAETVPSQQISAAETDPSKQIPSAEMVPSKPIPVAETVPSPQIPAADTVPFQQVPAAETDPSQQMPAAETVPVLQIPAAETDPSQQISAEEKVPSQQTPAPETGPPIPTPSLETDPSQKIPATEKGPFQQTPAAKTGPSQHTLEAETDPSKPAPAAEMSIDIKNELDCINTASPTTASPKELSAQQHPDSSTVCPPQTSSGISLIPTEENDQATSTLEAYKSSEHVACDLTLSPINTPSSEVNSSDSSMPSECDLFGNTTAITVASSAQTDTTPLTSESAAETVSCSKKETCHSLPETSSPTNIVKTDIGTTQNVCPTNASSLMKHDETDVSTYSTLSECKTANPTQSELVPQQCEAFTESVNQFINDSGKPTSPSSVIDSVNCSSEDNPQSTNLQVTEIQTPQDLSCPADPEKESKDDDQDEKPTKNETQQQEASATLMSCVPAEVPLEAQGDETSGGSTNAEPSQGPQRSQAPVAEKPTHTASTINVLSCSNLRDDTKVLLEQISAKNQGRASKLNLADNDIKEDEADGNTKKDTQISGYLQSKTKTWSARASPEERENLLKRMESKRKERRVYSRFEVP